MATKANIIKVYEQADSAKKDGREQLLLPDFSAHHLRTPFVPDFVRTKQT